MHWNFFFTLTMLTMVSAMPMPPDYCLAAGVLLISGYEVLLRFGGVADYIMHAPRTGRCACPHVSLLPSLPSVASCQLSHRRDDIVALPQISSPQTVRESSAALASPLFISSASGWGA